MKFSWCLLRKIFRLLLYCRMNFPLVKLDYCPETWWILFISMYKYMYFVCQTVFRRTWLQSETASVAANIRLFGYSTNVYSNDLYILQQKPIHTNKVLETFQKKNKSQCSRIRQKITYPIQTLCETVLYFISVR